MDKTDDDSASCIADWMSEGNTAPVNIDNLSIESQFALNSQGRCGKGFVYLEELDVLSL